jgi:adenylylsulfate kinase
MPHIVLDGDNVCHGLCRDLGFSTNDREENILNLSSSGSGLAKLNTKIGLKVNT